MDLASNDSSLSVDEPAAYGIVLLRRDAILVHTEDYELSATLPLSTARAPASSAHTG